MKNFLIILALLLTVNFSYASDHLDSPSKEDLEVADITDLFAFPMQKNGKTSLVLAMTVKLFAKSSDKFSDKINYSFHIRHANLNGFGSNFSVATSGEYLVSCTFTDSGKNVHCKVSKDNAELASASNQVGDTTGGTNGTVRLFAGLRADPFFFDPIRIKMDRKRDTSYDETGFPFPGIIPKNALSLANVLAIVVELDADKIFGRQNGTMLAVAGHTRMHTDHHGELVTYHIDRMGRPEITNFIMGKFTTSDDKLNAIKKQWNAEPNSFAVNNSKAGLYRKTIEDGLVNMDQKDQGLDWSSPHPVVDILMQDFLLLDFAIPCDMNSKNCYLEIEKARLRNENHKTAGGRHPNDDFVDIMLTLFINGLDRETPNRGDGIDAQRRPATNTFPYLAKP